MTPTCVCNCAWWCHRDHRDVGVRDRKRPVGECVGCGQCFEYRPAKGPLPPADWLARQRIAAKRHPVLEDPADPRPQSYSAEKEIAS
jgi:hypothetical protein